MGNAIQSIAHAQIETLEPRQFLSAAAGQPIAATHDAPALIHRARDHRTPRATQSYDLLKLLGYDRLGARFNYASEYKLKAPFPFNRLADSGSGNGTIIVRPNKPVINGKAANVIDIRTGDITTTLAWHKDAQGTHAALNSIQIGIGSFTLNLDDTRIAPKSLRIGQKHSDSGTFDGALRFVGNGQRLTGTIEGSVQSSTQLQRTEQVRVRAGTFNAVKGVMTLTFNGTLEVNANGQRGTLGYSGSLSQTFWAVPRTGVVKQQATTTISLKEGPNTATIKIDTLATLTSTTNTSRR